MKVFDRKDVFTIATIDDAKNYINCEGYFCDSFYKDLNKWQKGILRNINEDTPDYPFNLQVKPNCSKFSYRYRFFLPVDKVRKEKKWRAFTLEEFLNRFSIGTKISFRRRDITRSTYGLFEGCQTDIDETETYHKIIICNLWYTLDDLFEKYEYLDEHGDWQPFGVEE